MGKRLVVMAALAVLVAAACSAPAPTATATPTPAPTATATPTLAPTATATATATPEPTATPTPAPAPTATADSAPAANSGAADGSPLTWRAVVNGLSAEELACLREGQAGTSRAGLYDWVLERIDEPVFGGEVTVMRLPLGCFEQAKILDALLGRLHALTGGLSGESEACVREGFASVDLGLLQENAEGVDPIPVEDAAAALGPLIALAYCLNEEEAGAVTLADITGHSLRISVAQVVCIAEGVDLDAMFVWQSRSVSDPAALQQTVWKLFETMDACGVDRESAFFGG